MGALEKVRVSRCAFDPEGLGQLGCEIQYSRKEDGQTVCASVVCQGKQMSRAKTVLEPAQRRSLKKLNILCGTYDRGRYYADPLASLCQA